MNVRKQPILFLVSSALLLIVFWVTLLPVQLGGWVTYVIVDGISMEPGFSRGDLVLVRSASTYGVGDAVVYRDANMDSFVFHRIVGLELDRFVLQGDNNDWLDSYRPVRDEIIGKLWVSVPRLGEAIEWLRMPLHLSLTVGLLGGFLMLDLFTKKSQNKKERVALPAASGTLQVGILASAVVAFLFLALGIYSFLQPLDQPADNIPYQQEGYYYYSATGTPGVYDTDVVRSGEPVFPKLTCFLNIGYTYNVIGDLQGIAGSHKMYARIMDLQSGWQRTIPLNADAGFASNSYFTMATLDLCQVEAIVNLVEVETGLKQTAYTLEIVNDVSFIAGAEGNPVNDTFSQALTFKYDKVHFYLDVDSQADPLRFSQPGLAGSSESEMNTLSVLNFAIPIWILRLISLTGFTVSGLVLSALGMNLYRAASQSEEALTRLKYGSMLVDVYEQNLAPSSTLIDVASLDDLARLAERHGTMILHMPKNFLHFYFVQVHGTTYRYVLTTGRKGATEEELVEVQSAMPARPVVESVPPPTPVVVDETPLVIENHVDYAPPIQREVAEATVRVPVSVKETPRPGPAPVEEEAQYVIDTGMIEFEMPPQDTVFLRKIKI